MAGTTIAFMICSTIYSLVELYIRSSSCWNSTMFCNFSKCNDMIRIVYKYEIHDDVAGYKVSEHNEFYFKDDQQGDECVSCDLFDNDLINDVDKSEENLVYNDENFDTSCQADDEIIVSPFVVSCLESKKFKPSFKKCFYFIEMDGVKKIGAKMSKKNSHSKKIPRWKRYQNSPMP
ncbi:5040_t:CDS:2 [Funneliformis caledonium]|uniref:5040_t:CDS:1 n=1 Tax=Funneliformis caledonium TaxID=1117310 RepID=A0A9N9GWK4_9GLOM|nr:5040_t:CDS:2 [Funneliformis caledonium]